MAPQSQAPRSQDLQVGQVVAKKYRLDRLLGAGGMGFVALATHLQLDQPVALKFLRPEAAARPDLVKRFAQEARAAAKIRGDHVARVSDVSELDDGTPFMVMEYLAGEDLSERLTRTGKLGFAEAAGYVLEACEAIGEAHAMRIIHRDLKPSNLFLAQRPDGSEIVKVLDFGISKMIGDASAITQTQASFGSIPYMAPEQIRNARHCDERTDIWALGVTFYELISQNYPFPGTTGPEVIAAVMEGALVPIEHLRPDAPPLVRRVIALCTQRDPSQRYIDISELAMDLAGIVGTEIAVARARRVARLVSPSADQLNVGSLEVDVLRRASLNPPESVPPTERANPPSVPPARQPVQQQARVHGGTAPLGAAFQGGGQPLAPAFTPAALAASASRAQGSPTTGDAGNVVLSQSGDAPVSSAANAMNVLHTPPRGRSTIAWGLGMVLGTMALLGIAYSQLRPKPASVATEPVSSMPLPRAALAPAEVAPAEPEAPAMVVAAPVPAPSAATHGLGASDAGARAATNVPRPNVPTTPTHAVALAPTAAPQPPIPQPPAQPLVQPQAPAKRPNPNDMVLK